MSYKVFLASFCHFLIQKCPGCVTCMSANITTTKRLFYIKHVFIFFQNSFYI